jgi:hypothetical protein
VHAKSGLRDSNKRVSSFQLFGGQKRSKSKKEKVGPKTFCAFESDNAFLLDKLFYSKLLFLFLFQPNHTHTSNMDAGDAIAIVVGLFIAIIGIFAGLGAYSRKRAGAA